MTPVTQQQLFKHHSAQGSEPVPLFSCRRDVLSDFVHLKEADGAPWNELRRRCRCEFVHTPTLLSQIQFKNTRPGAAAFSSAVFLLAIVDTRQGAAPSQQKYLLQFHVFWWHNVQVASISMNALGGDLRQMQLPASFVCVGGCGAHRGIAGDKYF